MYKAFMPSDLLRLDPRFFCKALFKALGLNDKDFQFGMTKVFFRPGKFAEFDQLMKSDPENLRLLLVKVKKWIIRSRWRKAQWCALEVIKLKNKIIYRREALLTLQKNMRMALARKQHRPRYMGLARIRTLRGQVQQIGNMGGSLKRGREEFERSLDGLNDKVDQAVATIKISERIKQREIDRLHAGLVEAINREVSGVKKRIEEERIAEEQEKLRKLQLEMEAEKRRKQEEEEARRKMEEERLLRAEIENQRKKEEEEERRLEREERDKNQAEALQKQLEEANTRYAMLQQQIEQERRDHELALRLAAESGSAVEELVRRGGARSAENGGGGGGGRRPSSRSPTSPTEENGSLTNGVKTVKKHDLSKWKYAELRDTINTSCDIELLEGCREEFHRRLKVYHAWKAKNKKKNSTFNEAMRAPTSIIDEANRSATMAGRKSVTSNNHRYFRIPFVRPDGSSDGVTNPATLAQGGRGWWYAHFDGKILSAEVNLTHCDLRRLDWETDGAARGQASHPPCCWPGRHAHVRALPRRDRPHQEARRRDTGH